MLSTPKLTVLVLVFSLLLVSLSLLVFGGEDASKWVSLLPRINAREHASHWQRDGNTIMSTLAGTAMVLPVVPLDSYQLRFVFNRSGGDLLFYLPLRLSSVRVVFGQRPGIGTFVGLDRLDGKPATDTTNPTLTKVNLADQNAVEITCVMVGTRGVNMKVLLNDEPVLAWSGEILRLSGSGGRYNPMMPAVSDAGPGTTFTSIEIRSTRMELE